MVGAVGGVLVLGVAWLAFCFDGGLDSEKET
jgi:hypothetical protein